ncbi:MAG TPA: fumarylacetoacetate hydrolase family protein [Gammaproteobacteria bacterium]|nr:fumarylacetoacetate hydrolase family protein [Gammaproteobacteria bacterium]
MRLLSFERAGRASFGVAAGTGVVDAGERLRGEFASLRDVLTAGALNRLRDMRALDADCSLEDVRFLPPVPDPAAKILCVGVNYLPHIAEMGRERPEHPVLFVRFADSLVGHGRPLIRPRVSTKYDYEGELAVVIGRRARHVAKAEALDYVAGYGCFNDGSVRDFQRHGPQWTAGKNFHASGAFGPWLVTADEQPDPARFHLTTRLNGEVVQDESVGNLCFDVPALIEYCSIWTQLEPGDVIVTGTPGGVGAGRTPPLWLEPGDSVEVDISGIGVLRNRIAAEQD